MKFTAHDTLSILRRFSIADETNVPRDIKRLGFDNPSAINTLAHFRFKATDYAILEDETAQDNLDYIKAEIQKSLPGREGKLLINLSSQIETYGLPHKAKDVYLFQIGSSKVRLDTHLAAIHPEASRSTWQKHIKTGYVAVDGGTQTSPKFMIDPQTTVIKVDLPKPIDHSQKNLPILYIDDDVVVVDKPAGILTHHKNAIDDEFTVANFLSRYIEDDAIERSGIVHRLDRDTSGVLIGARHQKSFDYLKQQFSDRSVEKVYQAITNGVPKDSPLAIDLPILRSPTKPGSFMVHPKGKPAQTKLEILAVDDQHQYARLELRPLTGRTHQLRVHLKHLDTPIVGDRLYGQPGSRLYLHAHKLGLRLPNGQAKIFVSHLPKEFDELVGIDRDED